MGHQRVSHHQCSAHAYADSVTHRLTDGITYGVSYTDCVANSVTDANGITYGVSYTDCVTNNVADANGIADGVSYTNCVTNGERNCFTYRVTNGVSYRIANSVTDANGIADGVSYTDCVTNGERNCFTYRVTDGVSYRIANSVTDANGITYYLADAYSHCYGSTYRHANSVGNSKPNGVTYRVADCNDYASMHGRAVWRRQWRRLHRCI